MDMKRALWVILFVSLSGTAFSGVLTYQDLLRQSNACQPLGQPGTIFGYPPCVYGLVMYLLMTAVAIWGLAARR